MSSPFRLLALLLGGGSALSFISVNEEELGQDISHIPLEQLPEPTGPDDPNEPIRYRLVIDYRKINALLRPETYPTPSMSDTVHSFRQIAKELYEWDKEHGIEPDWDGKDDDDPNGAVLSVLDFSRAFYSVPMHPDSKWATTMIIPQLGAFQWKSAPMGMRTSPSTFCRYAANRLRKYSVLWEEAEEPKPQEPVLDWHGKPHPPPSRFCITYIDDCAICTASYYTHQQRVGRTGYSVSRNTDT